MRFSHISLHADASGALNGRGSECSATCECYIQNRSIIASGRTIDTDCHRLRLYQHISAPYSPLDVPSIQFGELSFSPVYLILLRYRRPRTDLTIRRIRRTLNRDSLFDRIPAGEPPYLPANRIQFPDLCPV